MREYQLGIDHSTVSRVQKSFKIYGTPSKRQRAGRPKIFGPHEYKVLEDFICHNAATRRMTYREIASNLPQLDVSEDTVKRACQELGFHKCVPKEKATLDKTVKGSMICLAQNVEQWGYDEWTRVIFSDEASFATDHRVYNIRVLRRPGEEYHPDCVEEELRQGRTAVMVWGAFCGPIQSELYVVPGAVSF